MPRVLDLADGFTSASGPTLVSTAVQIKALATITTNDELVLDGTETNVIQPVAGSAASQEISGTPYGTTVTWADGVRITFQGTSDVNTVIFRNTDTAEGMILNGDIELGEHETLVLVYSLSAQRWIQED